MGLSSTRCYAIATAAVIAFLIPLHVLANNVVEFDNLALPSATAFLAPHFLALAAILLAIGWIVDRLAGVTLFKIAIRYVFYFVCLTGFVLPLALEGGQIEIEKIPLNFLNLLLAAILAGGLTALSTSPMRKPFLIGFGVFLGATGVTNLATVASHIAAAKRGSEVALHKASKGKNIFVVSFDGLTEAPTLELIRENPALKEAFKDFVVFDNAISGHPATFSSIVSELLGDVDIKSEFGGQNKMAAALDGERLITNYLMREGFKVSTYGTYGRFFGAPERAYAYGSMANVNHFEESVRAAQQLFRYSLARTVSSHLAFDSGFGRFLTTMFSFDGETDIQRKLQNHQGPEWDKINLLGLQDMEGYIADMRVSSDPTPVAHFLHFVHTHFPIDLDENCEYRSDDKAWHEANQTLEGLKNESTCALLQMARFVEKLKKLGIYENSLIVLKSDHGQPVPYNARSGLESFKVRGHQRWGFSRYTPLLAIKNFDASAATPTFDDRPAILGDLATTLCRAAEKSSDCAVFPGYDLLGPSSAIPPNATYFINLVENSNSTFKLDGLKVMTFERSKNFLADLNDFLTEEFIVANIECGSDISLSAGRAYNNGKSDYRRWVTWYDDRVGYLKFRASKCESRSLVLTLGAGDNAPQNIPRFDVRVNGQSAAHTVATPTPRRVDLRITLPESADGEDLTVSVARLYHNSKYGYHLDRAIIYPAAGDTGDLATVGAPAIPAR
ncbi:MAG: hypothetical protein A3E78_00105 [Alphaproteobacteria bacterium RIFCSPHIGHO2_12_FULL_63_12]|nr:MAG: hypothetical protein A3E78_00105 [Alphaproteobacteria bacterium RIFCSPHIGHO2_12_FULL_63_12]